MEKNMSYRIYKKRFADCKNLGDYDSVKKTITVVIPDDDVRIQKQKRLNSKVWKSYGDEWRMRQPEWLFGFIESSFRVRKYEDGFYVQYDEFDESARFGFRIHELSKTDFQTRDEAVAFVESKWEEFRSKWFEYVPSKNKYLAMNWEKLDTVAKYEKISVRENKNEIVA